MTPALLVQSFFVLFTLVTGVSRAEKHVAPPPAKTAAAEKTAMTAFQPTDDEIMQVVSAALAGEREDDVPKNKLDQAIDKLRLAKSRRALPPMVDTILADVKQGLPQRVRYIQNMLEMPVAGRKPPRTPLTAAQETQVMDAIEKLRRGGIDEELDRARKILFDIGIAALPYVEAGYFREKDFEAARRLQHVGRQILKDYMSGAEALLGTLMPPQQKPEHYHRLATQLLPEKLAFGDVKFQTTLIRRELARLSMRKDVGGYGILVDQLIRRGFEHERQPIRDAASNALDGEAAATKNNDLLRPVLHAALTAATKRKDVEAKSRANAILDKLD